jgi:hypothetical protein
MYNVANSARPVSGIPVMRNSEVRTSRAFFVKVSSSALKVVAPDVRSEHGNRAEGSNIDIIREPEAFFMVRIIIEWLRILNRSKARFVASSRDSPRFSEFQKLIPIPVSSF